MKTKYIVAHLVGNRGRTKTMSSRKNKYYSAAAVGMIVLLLWIVCGVLASGYGPSLKGFGKSLTTNNDDQDDDVLGLMVVMKRHEQFVEEAASGKHKWGTLDGRQFRRRFELHAQKSTQYFDDHPKWDPDGSLRQQIRDELDRLVARGY